MKVYFAQHGRAEPGDVDPSKPLSAQGRNETMAVARSLTPAFQPARIVHSGKLRAAQTAEIFASELAIEDLAASDGLNPMDDVRALVPRLVGESLYVGHLPHLSRLVSFLTTGNEDSAVIQFRNSGVLCANLEPDGCQVLWYLTPELT